MPNTCKVRTDASVTIRLPISTPAQRVSQIRAETDRLAKTGYASGDEKQARTQSHSTRETGGLSMWGVGLSMLPCAVDRHPTHTPQRRSWFQRRGLIRWDRAPHGAAAILARFSDAIPQRCSPVLDLNRGTVSPLSLPPRDRCISASRPIRHHPPANSDSCSTG
jgi:hypothetical protein